jgi:hypothetical protein
MAPAMHLTEEVVAQWGDFRPDEDVASIEVEAIVEKTVGPSFTAAFHKDGERHVWIAGVLSTIAFVFPHEEGQVASIGEEDLVVPIYDLTDEAMKSLSSQVLGPAVI